MAAGVASLLTMVQSAFGHSPLELMSMEHKLQVEGDGERVTTTDTSGVGQEKTVTAGKSSWFGCGVSTRPREPACAVSGVPLEGGTASCQAPVVRLTTIQIRPKARHGQSPAVPLCQW
jgi:hypothetical protein